MREQILSPVQDVWRHHCAALEDALDQTLRELRNLVRLDEYHREGHSPEHLSRSLGPYGANALDLASLSQVLGGSTQSRAMPRERLERIQKLLTTLGEEKEACASAPPDCAVIDIAEDEARIRQLAEDHLNSMAAVFRNLRVAQLEIRSKYDPTLHDEFYAHFDWRELSPAELRLCPPFLVIAHLDGDNGPILRKMMALLESRKPLKIAALRSTLRRVYPPTADTTVPATLAVETVPLAMRGVAFLQSCSVAPDFTRRLFEVLSSPRAAVISILCAADGEDDPSFQRRANRAIRSRAFPLCSYDPDRARGFVSCFDLSTNPSPESLWTSATIGAIDEHGQPAEVSEEFTFAHFAAGEDEFADEFTEVDPEAPAHALTPLVDYLELNRRQRVGKVPAISVPGPDGTKRQLIVSTGIVTQTSDRMHLWKTLQEISGWDNPYVRDTRETLQSEFGVQQKALLESLQADMEKEASHREQVAVANAVRKLVAHLTGIDPASIDLRGMLAQSEE